jgi:aquaporin Z
MQEEQTPQGFELQPTTATGGGDEKVDLSTSTMPSETKEPVWKKVFWRFRWAAYTMEFIGTFYLTLVVALTASSPQQPLAVGCCLTALIYAGGHISGGHLNPTVSLAIFLRQKATLLDTLMYMSVQFLGGAIGSFAAWMASPANSNFLGPGVGSGVHVAQGFFLEFLFGFYLASCVLNVATVKAKANNHFYGMAIGFTVLGAAYSGSRISGAALNQAVALGRLFMKAIIENDGSILTDIWIYLLAPWIGSFVAAVTFLLTNWEEFKDVINEYRELGLKNYLRKLAW